MYLEQPRQFILEYSQLFCKYYFGSTVPDRLLLTFVSCIKDILIWDIFMTVGTVSTPVIQIGGRLIPGFVIEAESHVAMGWHSHSHILPKPIQNGR